VANEILITVRADDKASAVFGDVTKKAGGFGSALADIGKTAAGFLTANAIQAGMGAFTNFLGGAKEAAVNLGESLNAVNVVFGASSQKILQWGKDNASAYGLSNASFNQLVTPLGAMLQNYGFSADDAAQASIDLAKRAADMASVFNVDVSTALEAIQAGLRGEADPLEKFGVGLNAAAIQAKAMAMTGKDVASSLTDQEKKTAALALIMEQTDAVAGDFVNTSDSLANSERIAAAEAENQQAVIGNKLMPAYKLWADAKREAVTLIATELIPAIEALSVWLGPKLVEAVAFYEAEVKPEIEALLVFVQEQWHLFQVYYETEIKPALDNVEAAIRATVEFIRENWAELEGIIKGPLDLALASIEHFQRTIFAVFDLIIQLLQGDFSGAWEALKELIDAQLDFIVQAVTAFKDMILSILWLLGTAIIEAGRAAMNGLWRGMLSGWEDILQPWLRSLPSKFLDAIGDAGTWLYQKGRDLIAGFVNGMLSIPIPNPLDLIPGPLKSVGKKIPGFATGGVVPGPVGAAQLAVVHGGERVLTPGQQASGGGNTFVYAPTFSTASEVEAQRFIGWIQDRLRGQSAGAWA